MRWLVLVMVVMAVAAPMVAVFAPLGMTLLGGVTAVAVAACTRWRLAWRGPQGILLAACAWMALSTLWALNLNQAAVGTARMLALTVGGLAMLEAARRLTPAQALRLEKPFLLTMAAALAILAVEHLTNSGVSMWIISHIKQAVPPHFYKSPMSRGFAVVSLLAWPAAMLVARRWGCKAAVAFMLITLLALGGGDSLAARVALVVGGLFILASWINLRAAFAGFRVLAVVMPLAIPVIAHSIPAPQVTAESWLWLPNSAHHRLTIWWFTAHRIAEHPVIGWGMESARDIPGADAEISVYRTDPKTQERWLFLTESMLPLHPHNGILQIWLELGVPGIIMTIGLLLWLIRTIERADVPPWVRAMWGASTLSTLVVLCVSFGIWQSWWQSTLWMLAVLSAVIGRAAAKDGKP